MRAFVAIDLDEALREKVTQIQKAIQRLDVDVKFVEPENLHFTTRFLGEVSEDRITEIEKAISAALTPFKQFKIAIQGLGYFGSPTHIRTLWLDVLTGKERMAELVAALDRTLAHIRREKRKPDVHLTIGRVKSGRNRDALLREIERLKDVQIGEMAVKEVKLKQSILTVKGPIYSDVKVFKLK